MQAISLKQIQIVKNIFNECVQSFERNSHTLIAMPVLRNKFKICEL